MKYILDHSKDFEFEKAGFEPPYKSEWESFLSLRPRLSVPPFKEERVALFYELAKLLNASAFEHSAELEIIANEDNHLGGFTWIGQGFEVFCVEESPTKSVLALALQSANSVHLSAKDGKIQIFMVLNLSN